MIRRSTWVAMRYAFFILAFSAFISPDVRAQNSYYYGVSSGGGAANKGYIFRFSESLDNFEVVHDFQGQLQGTKPSGSLLEVSDGWLYGTAEYGGMNEEGVLYKFDPINGAYEVLHEFGTSYGRDPFGDLVQMADGRIYGLAGGGGEPLPGGASGGLIFSYDPQTQLYEMRHSFLTADGEFQGTTPPHGMTLGLDGKLYGTCLNGGEFGHGTIYSFDPEDDSFNTVHSFDDGLYGRSPDCRLLLGADGKLYGTASSGGPTLYGTIFRFDPTINHYSVIHSFNWISGVVQGRTPRSYQLVETNPGVFYGTTSAGGANFRGDLYRYSYINNSLTTLTNFGGDGPIDGYSLMALPDGRLFGYCGRKLESALGSAMYTYDFSMQGEDEEPFEVLFDDVNDEIPKFGLVFTHPILVNLTTSSVAEGRETDAQWLLYPNPATHRVYLPNAEKVNVYNTVGVCVYSGPVDAEGLDIRQWANGIYFVCQMEAWGAPQRTGRFVKQ